MRNKPATLEQVIFDSREAVAALAEDTEIAIDLETGGLSPWLDPIAVVSMYGVQSGTTALLHVRGFLPDFLRDFLNAPGKLYIGHNCAGFDSLFLAVNGIDIWANSWYDTMIGEQCTITSGRRDVRVNLQDTLARRTGVKILKGHGESSWMAPQLTEEQIKYCVEDIFYLPQIMQAQTTKNEGTPQAKAVSFEQGLSPIIAKMILNGLPIDIDALNLWRNSMEKQLTEAYKTIDLVLGPSVNIGSSQQLKRAFKSMLDIELESTDAETLASLSEILGPVGDVAKAISLARAARKRTGMYDEEWLTKYCLNGRIHARYWQVSTDTGRFSSSLPNLQQVPKDGRKVFGGVKGHKMVSVDYSQLEVRIAAAIAKDQAMINAFSATDIHSTVAAGLFQIPIEAVTKEQRSLAKAATFTLLFGGSANGLVRYAKLNGSQLPLSEAQGIVKRFFRAFPGLAMARQRAIYMGNSGSPIPINLPTGFRRVLIPKNGAVPPSQILNTSVQGIAAAGLKCAIYKADASGLMPYMCSTVHDELVACVPEAEVIEYTKELMKCMVEGMMQVVNGCPIGVEPKIGNHWQMTEEEEKSVKAMTW